VIGAALERPPESVGARCANSLVLGVTGRGVPDEAAIARGTAEFTRLTPILDSALEGREYVAGPLSIADFALASHYSLASTCGLDVTPHARVNAWLARVLARDSMRRALADAQLAIKAPVS
jgi:glutathione S-transferase